MLTSVSKDLCLLLFCQATIAFIRGNGDGIREIDAAGVFARHRDLEKPIAVAVVEVLREPRALIAEDERRV